MADVMEVGSGKKVANKAFCSLAGDISPFFVWGEMGFSEGERQLAPFCGCLVKVEIN